MPQKKTKQGWPSKGPRRWHPKKRGGTSQKSGDQDDHLTQSTLPCELCGLEFDDARSYQEHQKDPMHMELFTLANMKEAATLTFLQSHAKLMNERNNIHVELENPNAGTLECEFCQCGVKVGSENDWSLHQKTKHHFVAKMFKQRHCNVCVRLARSGSHISNLKHLTSVDHIQSVLENEKYQHKLHFEKPFCQEENLLRSSDHAVEVTEKFHHLTTNFEEAFDSSAEFNPDKLYGLNKIDLRMRHYCLACKLPVGLNKGAVRAGLLPSEMHCLTPDHYAMMITFLENNASEFKKEEQNDMGDDKTQEDTEENEEALRGSKSAIIFAEDDSSDGSKAATPQSSPIVSPGVDALVEDDHFDITQSPSPTRASEVILMPGKAFEDYGKAVLNKSGVSESDVVFPPFNRGFRVLADDHVFTSAYFAHVRNEFTSFSSNGKLEWEEACQAFSFIPTNSDSTILLYEDFMEVFSSEKLSPKVAEEQLNIPLQTPSEDLLTEDFRTKQHIFDILNILLASETVATTTSDADAKGAALATAKLTLRPLLHATQAFFTARRILRIAALKGYEYTNPHVSSLINSDPFCVKLFAKDAVEKLIQKCSVQSLTMSQLLGKCHMPKKRKLSAAHRTRASPLAKRSKASVK